MAEYSKSMAEDAVAGYEKAKKDRSGFDRLYQEASRYVLPGYEFNTQTTPGQEHRTNQFDDTAVHAHGRLASALSGMLTNMAMAWLALEDVDPRLNQDQAVQEHYQNAARAMLAWNANPASGFYAMASEFYNEVACFGTSCPMILDEPAGPRFVTPPMSGIWLCSDDRDRVSVIYRDASMTARQLLATFGKASDATTKKVRENKGADEMVAVIHCLSDRRITEPGFTGSRAWSSTYVEVGEKFVLRDGAFTDQDMPLNPTRWGKCSGEVYGRGPGVLAMPSIRSKNVVTRTMLEAGEMAVTPPVLVPANGMQGPFKYAPRAVNYYRSGTGEGIRRLDLAGNIPWGMEYMAMIAEQIKAFFFADVLDMPVIDRATAYEIQQRQNQRLIHLAPVLSRLYSEFLGPMMRKQYAMMLRRGLLGQRPEALADRTPSVAFVSPLAISQRYSRVAAAMSYLQNVTPLLSVRPELALHIDDAKTMRGMASDMNTAWMLRDEDEANKLIEEYRQSQQAAQNMQIAQTGADAMDRGASAVKNLRAAQVA